MVKTENPVRVDVKHPLPHVGGKSPRFVTREVAETMVREGRAVYPGDPKTPTKPERG